MRATLWLPNLVLMEHLLVSPNMEDEAVADLPMEEAEEEAVEEAEEVA